MFTTAGRSRCRWDRCSYYHLKILAPFCKTMGIRVLFIVIILLIVYIYIYSVRNCLYSDAEKLDLRATCNSARYDTEADESIVQAAILRLRGMLCVNCSWMLQL